MRRVTFLFALLLCVAAAAAATQQTLPNSFAGWTGTVQSGLAPMVKDLPAGVIEQRSTAFSEYGFLSGENGIYRKGPESLRVNVYRMKDPSGAYGLFTYLRPPEARRSDLAQHSLLSANEALALAGNVVIDVRGQNLPRRTSDLKALVQQVQSHAIVGALPTLWQDLPPKQLLSGTDKYVLGPRTLNQFFPIALGDSVGFSTGAEAEVARYRAGRGQSSLLLVDLPTPQIATQTLDQLARKFNVNGSNPGTGAPLFAKRMITTLAIVTGPTDADAKSLLNEVQSAEMLTWNQPVPKGKQADIGTIVVGTIVGTGIFCAFSIVAGLAFGGFRLAVKRAMPGKVFDREKHMQVIQLGLSSKPIRADDFYDRSGPRIKMGPVEKNLPDRVALRLFR